MVSKLDHAITFATMAHNGQFRKKSEIPYIVHPFAVAMLLMNEGCGENVVIAGLLHDTLEDTKVTYDELVHEFGKEVADIVLACSEPDRRASWKVRKQHTIDMLRHAPLDVKYVTCADKLHNVTTILNEYRRIGDAVWSRFHKGYVDQKWYYESIVKELWYNLDEGPLPRYSIFYRIRDKVRDLFGEDKKTGA